MLIERCRKWGNNKERSQIMNLINAPPIYVVLRLGKKKAPLDKFEAKSLITLWHKC